MHLSAFFSHHIDHPKEEFHVCLLLSIRRSMCRVSFGTVPLDNGWGFIGLSKDTLSRFRKKGNKPACLESTRSILFFGLPFHNTEVLLSVLRAAIKWKCWTIILFFSLEETELLLSLVNFVAKRMAIFFGDVILLK